MVFHVSFARAQDPGRIYRLGILTPGPRDSVFPFLTTFLDELRRGGFIEGQNLQIDLRVLVREDRASEVASAVIAAGADVICTAGDQLTRAVQQATRTIPIQTIGDDLVLSRLVSSLAHPGGFARK